MDGTQTKTKTQTKTQFRLQSQRMLLTYKTHLDKSEYISWAEEKFKTQGLNFIRLAHETGDEECPYEHTHIIIDLNKRCNLRDPRCLDYNNIHPHVKTLPNVKALNDAKGYIAKEDPDNKDLLDMITPIYTKVKECKSIHEALEKYCDTVGDAIGIEKLFNIGFDGDYRRRSRKDLQITLRPWQEELDNLLNMEPDDRTIIWIYDTKGGTGKTYYAKYKCDIEKSKYRIFTDLGTSKDSSTIVENELKSGWDSWGMFINLSRQAEHHTRMYSYIENIKDGSVTTQKYSGKTLRFDPPHVVILANWPPITNQLSMDRWLIYKIVDNKLVKDNPWIHISLNANSLTTDEIDFEDTNNLSKESFAGLL